MARHRNVRSMNYADEYEGYDDVYGHSVEDDYSISPSDAAYVFDRSKAQMSAYMAGDEDIAEEDEGVEDGTECTKRRDSDTLGLQNRNLSEIDEARLRSCLDEIRNVIGDSVSEALLADIILANDFDVAKSLDAALSNAASSKPPSKIRKEEVPLPQREPTARPITDDHSGVLFNVKEGTHCLDLSNDRRNLSYQFGSPLVKSVFQIPKFPKTVTNCNKENIHNEVASMGLGGKSLPSIGDIKVSGSNVYNIPSLTLKSSRIPPLVKKVVGSNSGDGSDGDEECSSLNSLMAQHATKALPSKLPNAPSLPLSIKQNFGEDHLPNVSDNYGNADSDEECSSLSALMARHASMASTPEHTSLSALADFHLKGNRSRLNSQSNSEFVIPSLKVHTESTVFLNNNGNSMEDMKTDAPAVDMPFEASNYDDGFVIDLLGALNPPDFRQQLERPQSRMVSEDAGENAGGVEEHESRRLWNQDRTCVLDAKPVLLLSLSMEQKLSSPLGRILSRRRSIRKSPYVRPSSPFVGDIVPFAFNTPSPDAIIRKHLRRL